MGEDRNPFVIADLPGLIAGAAHGAGLGIQFLRHVERCRVLLHLVDLAAEGDAADDLATVERELAAFNPDLLAARPAPHRLEARRRRGRSGGRPCAARRRSAVCRTTRCRAATGEGVPALIGAVADLLEKIPAAAAEET